jgi:hypothetical protein
MADDNDPSSTTPKTIDVTVKAGASGELRFPSLPHDTTVSELKRRIEDSTSIFARRQKLIFKGKVLADDARVVAPGGQTSITLMLLAAPAGSAAAGGGSGAAATRGAAAVAAAAAEARLKRAREGGGGAGATTPTKPPPPPTTTTTWRARRDNWGKTGVVAYRDANASEALGREAAEFSGGSSNAGAATALLFASLTPIPGPRTMDLSNNPLLLRLPREVFSPEPLRASLRSLRLVSCGLTTEGVPWAWLPPGLTALALDGNAIDRVPKELSEVEGDEEEEEEDGGGGRQQRRPRQKKLGRLALLTLSRNRIARFEPGALAFGGGGGSEGGGGAGAAAAEDDKEQRPSSSSSSSSCLRALDVSFNRALESLPWDDMAAGCLSSLVELDARGNRIRSLEPPTTTTTNPLSRQMPALRALRLDANLIRAPLPDSLFGGGDESDNSSTQQQPCPSLCVFTLDDNPITAQEMRLAKGWPAFDARRVAAASKRIESGVLLGRNTFSEGADAAEWERYK